MEPLRYVAVIVLCAVMASAYGIAHDMVTAHICVEYFTVFHPPVFRTDNPILLALGWGIIASWWVGAILGAPLAIASRAGQRPKRDVGSLLRPILVLQVVMGCCALVSGTLAWVAASNGLLVLLGGLGKRIPAEKHAPFFADLFAHNASYASGFLGGLVVVALVWRSRKRAAF